MFPNLDSLDKNNSKKVSTNIPLLSSLEGLLPRDLSNFIDFLREHNDPLIYLGSDDCRFHFAGYSHHVSVHGNRVTTRLDVNVTKTVLRPTQNN